MKAKTVKVRKPVVDNDGLEDINGMFNNMLNGERVPLDIVWPRYVEMRQLYSNLYETLQQLHDCPLMQRLSDAKKSLGEYLVTCRKETDPLLDMDLSDYDDDFSDIETGIHDEFDAKYRRLKTCDTTRGIFVSLRELIQYRKEFSAEDVSMRKRLGFIDRMPGIDWYPFVFRFNIKTALTMEGIGQNTYSFLVKFIVNYQETAHGIWKLTQQPDIDVDRFTEVIGNSIERLMNIPELHRCGNAFRKIKESLGMFKENFGGYYQNFIDTQNSTTIMHEFIMDVSKTNSNDPKLAHQFRTIINYYRKMATQQGTMDPNAKKLFSQIDSAFKKTEGSDINADIHKASREAVVDANTKASKKKVAPQKTAADAAAVDAVAPERDIDELVREIEGDDMPQKATGKSTKKGK